MKVSTPFQLRLAYKRLFRDLRTGFVLAVRPVSVLAQSSDTPVSREFLSPDGLRFRHGCRWKFVTSKNIFVT
jgi:hypothetical protein